MEPIRVLYVNGGVMSRGGIESYMMNYYRNLDKSKIQIDFIVHGFEKGAYDDEIISLGGKIYNIPIKSKDYIGNIKALRSIFSSGIYKIVHSHMDAMSTIVLKEAKRCGIPIRIAHSHNTQHLTNNKVKFLLNEYARKNIKKYANYLFACSKAAGTWLYGENEFFVIKNAIDIDKYIYSEDNRKKVRIKYGLESNQIIGHIGRFDTQKNHMFLLEVFKEVLMDNNEVKLVLVGDGNLKYKISEEIERLGITKNVIMIGNCTNIGEILSMFDVFVMPSLFEGLPVSAVEAQANGLKCIMANTITNEVKISPCVKFLSLNDNARIWAHNIMESLNEEVNRRSNIKYIENNGYDIKKEAKKLESFYINLVKKNETC